MNNEDRDIIEASGWAVVGLVALFVVVVIGFCCLIIKLI